MDPQKKRRHLMGSFQKAKPRKMQSQNGGWPGKWNGFKPNKTGMLIQKVDLRLPQN
jgi:hypothetical protein